MISTPKIFFTVTFFLGTAYGFHDPFSVFYFIGMFFCDCRCKNPIRVFFFIIFMLHSWGYVFWTEHLRLFVDVFVFCIMIGGWWPSG